MVVLSKFVNPFELIYLNLPKSIFKSIDKTWIAYILGGKKVRVWSEVLLRPINQGGLALSLLLDLKY